jgi:isopentenyl diphosphate isomerase/L-lactate dehydrogenase-like FMN-dependent dehydrogenase
MNLSGLKNILFKGGLGIIAVGIICAISWVLFSWVDNTTKNAITAAHNAGYAEATTATATATNAQLIANIKAIQQMEVDTNQKISNLQTVAVQQHKEIDSYNVTQIAVNHPDEVEAWANKTTGDLFTGIAISTSSNVSQPPALLTPEPKASSK